MLADQLPNLLQGRVVWIGIGQELRGDDGAGIALVRQLAAGDPAAVCLEAGPTPENCVGAVAARHPDTVLLVDAVDWGGKAGDFRLFEASETDSVDPSTHGFPLSLVMEEIRSRTGARVRLLGIQPESMKLGDGLGPAVRQAVERFLLAVGRFTGPEHSGINPAEPRQT